MTMTMTPAGGKAMPMNFSMKEDFMREDIQTERGTTSIIFDMKASQMIILIPQMQKYMVQSFGQQAPAAQYQGSGAPVPHSESKNNSSFTDTGVRENIQGYSCEKYHVTTEKESGDIWMTDQLGMFPGFFHGGGPGGRGSQPAPEWESALKAKGAFFPMRVVMQGPKGVTKMEVTAVEKQSMPDSLFVPPAGWTKFDIGAMMGGGGYPGGHP